MGYYVRVLALQESEIPLQTLQASLPKGMELIAEEESGWSQLVLRHVAGLDIALIERDLVTPGELGADEIQEFLNEIKGEKPQSAVDWLTEFLPRVKVIYAIQVLSGSDTRDGWSGIDAVRTVLWTQGGGILQADAEGFTNQEGAHILWQFTKDHEAELDVAVLGAGGRWVRYRMKLNDPQQKQAFLRGEVPIDAKLL
jgi:hypothetical protein